ncbi:MULTISPECIES: 16S rRNA (guanine(966)-N(2))-methyltransferase RsmD [unclassified Ectothiorhodospira]|uniref:16S rRNA (guanine(966)-N(2))-methyltransferase RsmD n=1 Tax=unclassified Ectothiorhodospira TaxID=2684909 RepID=UPI001EE99A87|nr:MULTISPECIES: 16S rRNA (guanine(966)-N(2))-methyltransferase RsmD [unclassified Ectothiorhodospira]MCG5515616.1 16S rRNA (guanine(966)-N(2))-methyltransferase RsmD [Ectothiorhodospira sp. 9100]MCG5518860.1 16S rRNA (guanine(966)-N(2))-methyltransferase RsmD [Ectothiorhodospira sp. 9905]
MRGAPRRGAPGRLRIIGGAWRSRRLPVPHAPGLRPTPDRVRETLFNWLQPIMPGARCLDLFAGSGALGFEAASRGASRVVMVERDARLAVHLREQVAALGAQQIEVQARDGLGYLRQCDEGFDLVFLDPPYRTGLLVESIEALERPGLLRPGARVYLEYESDASAPGLPAGWEVLRETRAGEVRGVLVLTPEPPPVAAVPTAPTDPHSPHQTD